VRHPLAIVAGAVVLLVAIRIAVGFLAWPLGSPEERRPLSQFLWIETIADIVVWLAAGGAIAWLARRAADVESDRRRLEHLAHVAVLAGGLAHEVRNHLNAIGAYTSLLRKAAGTPDGELAQGIEKLERVSTALDELLTDFLTFTRPVKDNLEQVDLADLAGEVIDFLALDLEQARVEAGVEAAPGVPPVVGDRGKLRRVILNLLVNARQAMPQGGKATVRVQSHGGQVQLDVEDTGCGIPPEEQPRIFEAFFSTKDDGTGLGLAIAKRTIEDLGGRISFESRAGCGTTFHIALPTAAQHEATMRRLGRPHLETAGPIA
jgi:signal transduction histidine kinase